MGHLVRVFLKNLFKTFLGRKHIVFSWPNKAMYNPCTIQSHYVQSTTSMYLKTKLAIRTEKAERNDKNDCKNQVFAAKTILNYLRTGNREFIRCSVLFAVREITKQPDFPSGIVNFCHGTFRLGPLKLTHLALKHNCRSFGQTHRCSSSLANSPMSDSFLEEDQLSKCNVGTAGNSCVFFIVRLRVK